MVDWQHALRNQLNLVLYLSNSARDAAQRGRDADVLNGLTQIDEAIVECSHLLERFNATSGNAASDAAGKA